MQIRAATLDDHNAVLKLMRVLNPDDPELESSVSRRVFSQILQSTYFFLLVAESNEVILGTCYVNIIPNLTRHCAPYALLENVVTHPDYRRQGIGKKLLMASMAHAEAQGCYKLMLLTGGDKQVLEFYRQCGLESESKTAFIKRWDTR